MALFNSSIVLNIDLQITQTSQLN